MSFLKAESPVSGLFCCIIYMVPHGHKKRAVGATLIEVIIAERSLEEFIASLSKREVWRECQYSCPTGTKKEQLKPL